MTKQGWEYIQEAKGQLSTLNSNGTTSSLFSGALGFSYNQDSREQVLRTYEGIFASTTKDAAKPVHIWQDASGPLAPLAANHAWRQRNELLLFLGVPQIKHFAFERQLHLMHLEAVRTMIAIERYRRAHNALPPDLTSLVPTYLDAVPPDRFTGKLLIYAPADSTYTLYSVGPDRTDDNAAALTKDSQPIDSSDIRFITPDRAARAVEQNNDSLCPLGDIVYHQQK